LNAVHVSRHPNIAEFELKIMNIHISVVALLNAKFYPFRKIVNKIHIFRELRHFQLLG
jgi:hypothetical protein